MPQEVLQHTPQRPRASLARPCQRSLAPCQSRFAFRPVPVRFLRRSFRSRAGPGNGKRASRAIRSSEGINLGECRGGSDRDALGLTRPPGGQKWRFRLRHPPKMELSSTSSWHCFWEASRRPDIVQRDGPREPQDGLKSPKTAHGCWGVTE